MWRVHPFFPHFFKLIRSITLNICIFFKHYMFIHQNDSHTCNHPKWKSTAVRKHVGLPFILNGSPAHVKLQHVCRCRNCGESAWSKLPCDFPSGCILKKVHAHFATGNAGTAAHWNQLAAVPTQIRPAETHTCEPRVRVGGLGETQWEAINLHATKSDNKKVTKKSHNSHYLVMIQVIRVHIP